MSNQSKLQQQYSELKTQVSGSQKCSSVETSPRVGIVDGQHLHEKKDDNQESISHSNKRHGVELEVCSPISKITPNTRGTVGPKRSTSKADATRLDKGQVASQGLLEKKQAKRNVSKEETEQLTSSKYVEGHKSNIHITTSRC